MCVRWEKRNDDDDDVVAAAAVQNGNGMDDKNQWGKK